MVRQSRTETVPSRCALFIKLPRERFVAHPDFIITPIASSGRGVDRAVIQDVNGHRYGRRGRWCGDGRRRAQEWQEERLYKYD